VSTMVDEFYPCPKASCPSGVRKSQHDLGNQFCEHGHFVSPPASVILREARTAEDDAFASHGSDPDALSHRGLASQASEPDASSDRGLASQRSDSDASSDRGGIHEDLLPSLNASEPGASTPTSPPENSKALEKFLQHLSSAFFDRNGAMLAEHREFMGVMQQEMKAHAELYGDHDGKILSFILNMSEAWHPYRVYFKGEVLHRQSISGTIVEMVARQTHTDQHPLVSFLDTSNHDNAAWCMLIHTTDELVLHAPGQSPSPMRAPLSCDGQVAVCWDCSAEHLIPDLLYEKRDPERGCCDQCHSTEFLIDAYEGTSELETRIVYDRRSRCFHEVLERTNDRLDLKALWHDYRDTGGFQIDDFLSDEIKLTSVELNELLRLELSLHVSGAELYAALRSLDLSSRNAQLCRERVLRKLKIINRELREITEQL
jgi:hypothetical protein